MPTTGKDTGKNAGAQQQKTPVTLPRAGIVLSFSAFLLIGANDGTLGVVLPSMRAHYQVNDATIGLLFLAITVGYITATFNSGLLVGKLGYRRFLCLGAAIFLLSTGALSLMPPFVVALVAALFMGSGTAIFDAGLNTYIASLPRNTSMLNYLHACYGAGAWLGPVVASAILAINAGWNSTYRVWACVSLLLLLSFALFFKDRVTTQPEETHTTEDHSSGSMRTTLKLRVVWLAALFLLFYVGAEVSLGSWGYSFLTEQRHVPLLFAGWIVSGYWLGLMVGRLVLGKLGQYVSNRRLIEGALLGVTLGLLLVWLAPTQIVCAAGLWLTGFCLGPIFPTTIALTSTLVSARILPQAIGFITSLGSMGGALFSWLAGNVAQQIGIWALPPYVIVLAAGMLGIWFALQRRPGTTSTGMLI